MNTASDTKPTTTIYNEITDFLPNMPVVIGKPNVGADKEKLLLISST
jgi:hypothetical protein